MDEPIAQGSNPMHGRNTQGITATACSVSKLQFKKNAGGPLQVELDPSILDMEDPGKFEGSTRYHLCRLMVDQNYQGQGYGKLALNLLCDYVKTRPNYNFEVRVCQWTANFPAINMVIFDRRRVFVALTGFGATETAGFQVSDRLIADYFVDYYNNIWGKSDDLNKFLDRVAKGEVCIDE